MSASLQVTIGGVDRTALVSGLRYRRVTNGIGRASFTLQDPTGTVIPEEDQAVVVSVGGTPRWGGEIAAASITFLGWTGGIVATVECADHNQLAQRVLVNTIFAPQTLKAILQSLTGPGGVLAAVNVTLDPSQVTGPTLGTITCPWWTVERLLNHLASLTGYLWTIDASKVLSMWAVGSRASGVTLSLAQGNVVSATWKRHRWDYRNRQWVIYGPTGVQAVTDQQNGDGSTRIFPLHYYVSTTPGSITIHPDDVVRPVGLYGVDAMEWTFEWTSAIEGRIRQDPGSTPLSSSQHFHATFDSPFPNVIFRTDAGEVALRGEWNRADQNADIVTYDESVAWGDALIRQNKARPQAPAIVTTADGIDPGETVVVSLAELGLSATCFVTGVETTLEPALDQVDPVHALTLLAGTEQQATSEDLWRRIIAGSAAGGGAGGGGGGGGMTGGTTTLRAHLGGSRFAELTGTSWTPIPDYQVLHAPADGDYTLRGELRALDAGTGVQVRVYDVTAAAVVGDPSTAVSATSWTEIALVRTLAAGHRYRIEWAATNANAAVQVGQATMEI